MNDDVADYVHGEVLLTLSEAGVPEWVRDRVEKKLDMWIDDTIAMRKQLRDAEERAQTLREIVFRNVGGDR